MQCCLQAIHGIVVERKKILPAGGFHECKECSFRTKRADTLRMHVKTKHDKIRDHKCPQCPFSTANKRVLDAHVASRKHRLYWPDADGAYRCKFAPCEYTGTSYHKFLQHVMGVHMKHKEHQCPQCEFRLAILIIIERRRRPIPINFRSSYKGHIRVHLRQKHSEKVNVCDTCGFDAGSKQELRLHVRIEHEQRQVYSCDACDFSTVHSDSLIKHSKKTHGQTALVFACDACQFRLAKLLHVLLVRNINCEISLLDVTLRTVSSTTSVASTAPAASTASTVRSPPSVRSP